MPTPQHLYHGTSTKHLAEIRTHGISAPSYWGSLEIAEYYAEVVAEEEGGLPVILGIETSSLDSAFLSPDDNSIAEPLTFTLGKTEQEVWQEWAASQGTWQECYEIVESVKYNKVVPSTELFIVD